MITAEVLFERIYNYSNDIVKGDITACKKHKSACKRFLADIEKISDDSYPYYFDIDEVFKFYKWANMFKHTKGILAGQKIELMDFSLFVVSNIFAWKKKESNHRKHKKSYIQLSRKNMKSQKLAIISSYEAFLSKEQSEVYIAGWGREQSSIVYNEILSQIRECDILRGKYTDSYGKITHSKSGSVIQPLSKESRKTGDGKNPSFAVIDEFHCHETSEIYDVLISGMVARPNGHICIITTAGFSLASPCYREYQYVSKILDEHSPVENDEYFVMICELDEDDDIKVEDNWTKCNPIVSTYKEGMDFLRSELRTALDVPEKMRNFLTKNMNRWVDHKENGYMPMDKWAKCEGTETDLSGLECYVGVDLSKKIDLSSVSFEFPMEDGSFVIKHHSFIPEDTLVEKRNTDKFSYDLYIEQEYITATPGSVIDYSFIEEYIESEALKNNWIIKEICYDPYNATQFAQNMEAKGYTLVEIRQGIKTLGEPTQHFRECVFKKKITHLNDPVLTWAVGNAITKQDAQDNIMLDKSKSTERIDPIAATINAHVRCMNHYHNNQDMSNHFLSGWTL